MSNYKNKLDEMQDRLKIDALSYDERKKLFNDLKKNGGKIVDMAESNDPYKNFAHKSQEYIATQKYNEKSKKISDAKIKRKRQEKVGDHAIRSATEQNPFRDSSYSNSIKNKQSTSSSSKKNLSVFDGLSLFWIKLNCFIAGFTNWSATKFKSSYIKKLTQKQYKQILELSAILQPIFESKNLRTLDFRTKMFEENKLLDYELAYHTYHLFNIKLFDTLPSEMPISVLQAEDTLKQLFKTLYSFNKYSAQLKISTLVILQKFRKMYPKSYSVDPIFLFERLWSSLFITIYFDLEQIMYYYMALHNNKAHLSIYNTLDEYLGITSPVVIGKLAQEWREQHLFERMKKNENNSSKTEDQNSSETIAEQKSAVYPNQTIQEGVEYLIHNIPFYKLLQQFKENGDLRTNFTPDDKLFYTYILVDYLDKEFAMLWNGDVVQYFTVTDGTNLGRFDAKKEINILNTKLSTSYELINGYLKQRNVTEKMISTTYDKKNPLINQHLRELSRTSFDVRNNVEIALYNLMLLLDRILQSQNTANPLIGNGAQIIALNKTYSGKMINGMTVSDALTKARQLIASILWLLKYGDLSGLSNLIVPPIVLGDIIADLETLNQHSNHKN